MISQLIANAVKFTNEGQIEVVACRESKNELRIEVHDTGVGIPSEKMSIIFDSFRQANSGLARSHAGLGLGLALAQRIASLFGGEITAKSEPGSGTTFTALIPVRIPGESGEPASGSGDGKWDRGESGWSVLVVDDNRVSQTVISHILRRHGVPVQCASSGAEALHMASKTRFDLVLMDLQMPDLDGLETTKLLRKTTGYAGTPILALTANYSDVYRDMALEHGMQSFLSKPVQAAELLSTIHKFLRK